MPFPTPPPLGLSPQRDLAGVPLGPINSSPLSLNAPISLQGERRVRHVWGWAPWNMGS